MLAISTRWAYSPAQLRSAAALTSEYKRLHPPPTDFSLTDRLYAHGHAGMRCISLAIMPPLHFRLRTHLG